MTEAWLSDLVGYDRNDPDADSKDYPVEVEGICKGRAALQPCASGKCWTWSLSDLRCTGKGDVQRADWLNADSAAVCRTPEGWKLDTSIVGMGSCVPEGTTDARGELVRLTLSCEWKCSPGDPCRGGAEYEFTRDTLP